MTTNHLSNDVSAGLMLVHGGRPERLLELLIAWMRRYPLAPLETETVLVQSNGIAQWLQLALAADADAPLPGLGVSAAIDTVLPARFIWQAYRAVIGEDRIPQRSPFDRDRLVWRLMRLLPTVLEDECFEPLRRFLADDDDQRRRFQLAQRIADQYDQYQVYRADWLAAWAESVDTLPRPGEAPSAGAPLPPTQRWQARLWRRLLEDVATLIDPEAAHTSRASVHARFLRAVADHEGPRPAGLPRRVVVFGISSLPQQSVEVLAGISRWTQVLICAHNPCRYDWSEIVPRRELLRAASRLPRRQQMPTAIREEDLHLHAHPLLAAWGRQGRDFIGLLSTFDDSGARGRHHSLFEGIGLRTDLFDDSPDDPATLLAQLQDDILELRPVAETLTRWGPVDPKTDHSIRFHVAHGPQREVEILHDQLLAAFDRDPTLHPRDVIVMVPDIDAYAPHIAAVFGRADAGDRPRIPFALADRGRRRSDPIIDALARLLELPRSRLTATDVLDLLEVPALRRRFGIQDTDLPRLHRWIQAAGIRWGLDGAQRQAAVGAAGASETHSWRFGLRRMLLGYALGHQGKAWQDIEPFEGVGGLDAALLGPLSALVDALDDSWRALSGQADPDRWCESLRALLQRFFEAVTSDETLSLARCEQALQDWQQTCEESHMTEALPLSVVGQHWLERLEQPGLGQRFPAGVVGFATLMPMRAIPFRHICLLGLNDGDYPRRQPSVDFDLMAGDYRPGDRSRREDDRYLFLEALLSARDHLHLSWVGQSIHDNVERPPSVLLAQLREHLDAGWRLVNGTSQVSAALTQSHRLQAFNADYFNGVDGLFTYAGEWRSAAHARHAPADLPGTDPTTLPLAPFVPDTPLSIESLGSFLRKPVQSFYQRRLNVHFDDQDPDAENHEPFELDGLSRWQLQNALIQAQLQAGIDDESVRVATLRQELQRVARRGELPAGGFGEILMNAMTEPMKDLFDRYRSALNRWPTPQSAGLSVRHQLTDGETTIALADQLTGIRRDEAGNAARILLEPTALIDKGNHYRADKMIGHWVAHLAACLGAPLTTIVISSKGTITLAPLPRETAVAHLDAILRAWSDGMRRPLPLATKTGFAWLTSPQSAANVYRSEFNSKGECDLCPYLRHAWPSYERLTHDGAFAALVGTLLKPLRDALPAKANQEA